MVRFAYIGDHAETFVLGLRFIRGQSTEVTAEAAVRKLRSSGDFTEVADPVESAAPEAPKEPKRRGRPPKARE